MSIVLLREEDDDDYYHKLLYANGFFVCSIPVLCFSYYNIEKLEEFFHNLSEYSALIITSKHATYALEVVLKKINSSFSLPQNLYIYVVGKSTELYLQKLGLNSLGCDSGNADQLADYIIKRKNFHLKPLMFVCGNLARETIPDKLRNFGLIVETISCYKTIADDKFPEKISQFIKQYDIPNVIVFFSPSGVKFYFSEICKLCADFKRTKILSIGQHTADCIVSMNKKVDAIAKRPTPDSLLEAIQSVFDISSVT
ncbi:uroporphyrinogen-III synthase isoform X2 [Hydra vulgaris]|uniref:Uroporphyrinogen-III synthase isoform X2 n=1 Tax=Hydra vulgaris TaxID=6087 RepID=A0ABM4D3I6_HYDVU